MTEGQRAIDIAEGQVGCIESPKGSNQGACVNKYQDVYGSYYHGQPWCGCFVGWVWEQTRAGGKQYSSPSTQIMCDMGNGVSPQAGAAFVICGTHTGLLRYKVSGSVWATVEGNHNDQVAFSQRDISGMHICGPPWLGQGEAAPVQETMTAYFLQDTVQRKNRGQGDFYGPWEDAKARDNTYRALKEDLGHELRTFSDPDFPNKYGIDNTDWMDSHGGVEIYGGWQYEDSRDSAKKTLEDRLNRELRKFSETRTKAQGYVPWFCKNLWSP